MLMLLFQVKSLKNCRSFYHSYLDPVGNMVQLDRRTLTFLDQRDLVKRNANAMELASMYEHVTPRKQHI